MAFWAQRPTTPSRTQTFTSFRHRGVPKPHQRRRPGHKHQLALSPKEVLDLSRLRATFPQRVLFSSSFSRTHHHPLTTSHGLRGPQTHGARLNNRVSAHRKRAPEIVDERLALLGPKLCNALGNSWPPARPQSLANTLAKHVRGPGKHKSFTPVSQSCATVSGSGLSITPRPCTSVCLGVWVKWPPAYPMATKAAQSAPAQVLGSMSHMGDADSIEIYNPT